VLFWFKLFSPRRRVHWVLPKSLPWTSLTSLILSPRTSFGTNLRNFPSFFFKTFILTPPLQIRPIRVKLLPCIVPRSKESLSFPSISRPGGAAPLGEMLPVTGRIPTFLWQLLLTEKVPLTNTYHISEVLLRPDPQDENSFHHLESSGGFNSFSHRYFSSILFPHISFPTPFFC